MLKCIGGLSAADIVSRTTDTIPMNVVVDGRFLPASPRTLWQQGRFHRVPYLIGSTSDDGALFLPGGGNDVVLMDTGIPPAQVWNI